MVATAAARVVVLAAARAALVLAAPRAPVVHDLFGADSSAGGWRGPALVTTNASVLIFGSGVLPSGAKGQALRRSTDSGASWSSPEVLPYPGMQPMYDPDSGDVVSLVHLPHNTSHSCAAACGHFATRSSDDGRSWSVPTPVGGLANTTWGNGLASGVALRKGGALLAAIRTDCADPRANLPGGGWPANCTRNPDGSRAAWNPATERPHPTVDRALISTDSGVSWHAGGGTPLGTDGGASLGWTECQLAELANGSVVLTSRTIQPLSHAGALPLQRVFAISHTGGETWQERWWGFPANQSDGFGEGYNTEGSLISAAGGERLLLSKPTAGCGDARWPCNHNLYRRNMTVASSSDGGSSWSIEAWGLVYAGLAAYSDMTELPNGQIGIAFERGTTQEYRFVSFAAITPPWRTDAAA